jgi:hypothetical protein
LLICLISVLTSCPRLKTFCHEQDFNTCLSKVENEKEKGELLKDIATIYQKELKLNDALKALEEAAPLCDSPKVCGSCFIKFVVGRESVTCIHCTRP